MFSLKIGDLTATIQNITCGCRIYFVYFGLRNRCYSCIFIFSFAFVLYLLVLYFVSPNLLQSLVARRQAYIFFRKVRRSCLALRSRLQVRPFVFLRAFFHRDLMYFIYSSQKPYLVYRIFEQNKGLSSSYQITSKKRSNWNIKRNDRLPLLKTTGRGWGEVEMKKGEWPILLFPLPSPSPCGHLASLIAPLLFKE